MSPGSHAHVYHMCDIRLHSCIHVGCASNDGRPVDLLLLDDAFLFEEEEEEDERSSGLNMTSLSLKQSPNVYLISNLLRRKLAIN